MCVYTLLKLRMTSPNFGYLSFKKSIVAVHILIVIFPSWLGTLANIVVVVRDLLDNKVVVGG